MHEVVLEVDGVVVCEVAHLCEAVEVVLVVVDEVDSVTVEDVEVVVEADSSQEEHHEEVEVIEVDEVVVDSEVDVVDTRFCFLGRCTICLTLVQLAKKQDETGRNQWLYMIYSSTLMILH